jgi:hypothetical protein
MNGEEEAASTPPFSFAKLEKNERKLHICITSLNGDRDRDGNGDGWRSEDSLDESFSNKFDSILCYVMFLTRTSPNSTPT